MYISLDMNQYNEKNIMISEKTKNNIMSQGDFYRLYFSTPDLILNGLHITFELKNISIEKYFNKIKCCFDNTIFNNNGKLYGYNTDWLALKKLITNNYVDNPFIRLTYNDAIDILSKAFNKKENACGCLQIPSRTYPFPSSGIRSLRPALQ